MKEAKYLVIFTVLVILSSFISYAQPPPAPPPAPSIGGVANASQQTQPQTQPTQQQTSQQQVQQEQEETAVTAQQSNNTLIYIAIALFLILIIWIGILIYLKIRKPKMQSAQQINPQLLQYVKDSLRSGYNREQIKTALLRQGYSQQQIDEAMKYA